MKRIKISKITLPSDGTELNLPFPITLSEQEINKINNWETWEVAFYCLTKSISSCPRGYNEKKEK